MAQSDPVQITATSGGGSGLDADRGVQIGESTEIGQTPTFGAGRGFRL
jgi:hypothetical protein